MKELLRPWQINGAVSNRILKNELIMLITLRHARMGYKIAPRLYDEVRKEALAGPKRKLP